MHLFFHRIRIPSHFPRCPPLIYCYSFKMQLSTLLALAPLFSSFASAECYSGGLKWPSKEAAFHMAQEFCSRAKGEYQKDQDWGRCLDGPSNSRINFRVWNKSGSKWPIVLPENTCYFRMAREIIGCERGGRRSEGNWEVMSVA